MSNIPASTPHTAFLTALREVALSNRGIVAGIESHAREFARARRLEGVNVEKVIIEVKAMVRDAAPRQELVILPKLVGWTVAGYFDGAGRTDTP